MNLLIKLLTGGLVDSLTGLAKAYINKEITEAELQAGVRKHVLDTYTKIVEQQASVVIAEARGEDWLQRNWRPVAGLSLVFVILFYVLLLPVAVDWFGLPPVRTGDVLLLRVTDIAVIAMAGYVGGEGIKFLAGKVWK